MGIRNQGLGIFSRFCPFLVFEPRNAQINLAFHSLIRIFAPENAHERIFLYIFIHKTLDERNYKDSRVA